MMSEQEKVLKLASLMGWEIQSIDGSTELFISSSCVDEDDCGLMVLDPYAPTMVGLAQFAAILLRFPEVMWQKDSEDRNKWEWSDEGGEGSVYQKKLLDELLCMHGVDV